MWESRGLCEISKALWKPFLGFHGDVISTAACPSAIGRSIQGVLTLVGVSIVVRGPSSPVELSCGIPLRRRVSFKRGRTDLAECGMPPPLVVKDLDVIEQRHLRVAVARKPLGLLPSSRSRRNSR